jgi:hypothetical protein
VTPEQTTRMNLLAARANAGDVLGEEDSADLRRLTGRYRAEQRTVADLRNLVDDVGPAVAREVWDAARDAVFAPGAPKMEVRPKSLLRDLKLTFVVDAYRLHHRADAGYLEIARHFMAQPLFADLKFWPKHVQEKAVATAMKRAVERRTKNP